MEIGRNIGVSSKQEDVYFVSITLKFLSPNFKTRIYIRTRSSVWKGVVKFMTHWYHEKIFSWE